MNLFDLETLSWNEDSLHLTANLFSSKDTSDTILKENKEKLKQLLGKPAEPWKIQGEINNFFVNEYNFNENCKIISCSGDNPCSLVGCGVLDGDIVVSLGTSDTLMACGIQLESFLSSQNLETMEDGHVFSDPINKDKFMGLLCFKNGSLARERVRDEFCNEKNWDSFNSSLNETNPGNDGNIAFYYFEPEITPRLGPGVFRFNENNQLIDSSFSKPEYEVRALVESQFMSMKRHAKNIGMYPERFVLF